jgi:hypothetical protein
MSCQLIRIFSLPFLSLLVGFSYDHISTVRTMISLVHMQSTKMSIEHASVGILGIYVEDSFSAFVQRIHIIALLAYADINTCAFLNNHEPYLPHFCISEQPRAISPALLHFTQVRPPHKKHLVYFQYMCDELIQLIALCCRTFALQILQIVSKQHSLFAM